MDRFTFILLLSLLISTVACEEIETYSEIPRIEFSKIYLADTLDALGNDVKLQRIHVQVVDGDGNVGLNRNDTTEYNHPDSIWYYNLYVTLYNKNSDGTYTELSELSENMRYRIPYKEPIGQNKYMKAEVIIKVEIPLSSFNYETVRYDFYIYDRDRNKSETAQSCDIPLKTHGYVNSDGSIDTIDNDKE